MSQALSEAATSRHVMARNIKVHFNEAGRGPPVIFCEGQGPGTSAWVVYHRVIGPLSRKFRCLLLDQPGYGKSDAVAVKGESRSTMYARTIRDFMDALEIKTASLIDMSFGAQTAQVFAVENPDRVEKLVLHASGVPGVTMFAVQPTEGITIMAETFKSPTLANMRRMMNSFLYDGESYSDEELMLQARLDAWLSRPELEKARRESVRIQRDLTADLQKIKVPVLQIHGRHDRVSPLESALRLFTYLPDTRLVVLNRCGHWAPIEQPEEFIRLVADFLENAKPSQRA
jgi:2-hydroxy-6-oxonona-2,4-dienedioate hydrolase